MARGSRILRTMNGGIHEEDRMGLGGERMRELVGVGADCWLPHQMMDIYVCSMYRSRYTKFSEQQLHL